MEPSIKDCLYTENIPERPNEKPARQRPTLETLNEGLELHTTDATTMEEGPDRSDVDRQGEDGGQHQHQQVRVKVTPGGSDEAGQDLQQQQQQQQGPGEELEDHVFRTTESRPPWGASRSLSPLVATDSMEDFDLPPQLMMCRRDSVTFISIPRSFQRSQLERCDTAPPCPADPILRQHKGLLKKSSAIGGLGSPEPGAPRDLMPSAFSRRTSTSHLPVRNRLSVNLDDRLSRSHDDLSTYRKSGYKRKAPLGITHRTGRSGAGLFLPSSTSLDVPHSQTEDEDSFDDEVSPVVMRRRRRSSATILHRQSSGVTLCVPLQQHSLDASPVETEEEDVEEASTDELSSPASTEVFLRRASGTALGSPVTHASFELSEKDNEDSPSSDTVPHVPHVQGTLPQLDTADICDADESDFAVITDADSREPLDEAFLDEEPPPGGGAGRGLHKKGSIAIPLERCLDSFSESYFAVKGAALILPQSECPRTITRGSSHGGDIQNHLQSMFYLLRPPDTIKVAVKLESVSLTRNRYMAVVSTVGRQDTEESVILGIDIEADKATIGLVLPIWGDTAITLDGDGGFKVTSNERLHIFKPVSVQAMWSALQSVIKARDTAHHQSYYPGGLTHTWVQYYEAHISSNQTALNEWNTMEDIESHRPPDLTQQESLEQVELEKRIKIKLKEIMLTVDLEEVTSKYLRTRLEEEMGMGLKDMRQFIDEEMIVILRQMDSPSEIFPFLFLGSEWNASNLEELQQNGVNQILNVTREIDNFFPGLFDYSNIRVYDIETAELLKHWDNTYKFIKKAETSNEKVLVHCKMGISRSASSVIAFAMKEYGWSLQEAFEHVKKKRSCIRPNKGFWQQLITYEGILDASKQRNSKLWRSKSVGDLSEQAQSEQSEQDEDRRLLDELLDYSGYPGDASSRPRSWSPQDSATQILIKTHNLASDESSDEEIGTHDTELDTMHQEYEGVNATPFLASWDDVDDMSSQSMDSLLDTEQGTKSAYDGRPQPRVVLLSYRAFSGSDGDHGGLSDGVEVLTEESDVEDIVAEECSGRVQRGFYDVQMLTAEFLGPAVQDEVPNHINYFLHPDYKMDLLMAQQRKHRRVAQLLKLSQPPEDSDSLHKPFVVDAIRPHMTPATLPQVAKLRADNSWIKDVPPSPQSPTQASDSEGEEEGQAGDVSPPVFEAAATGPVQAAAAAPAAVAQEVPKPSTTQTLPESPPAAQGALEEASTPDTETNNTTAAQDIGVVQHYQKEDIPWNPGTVKRHKHHLESKLNSKSNRSQSPRTSGSSSTSGSSESLDEIEIVGGSAVGERVVVDIGGVEVGESCTDDPSTEHVQTCGAEGAEYVNCPTDGLGDRPASIYELEDIAVTPGVVQRTKQEIEKRGSVTSQEIDLDYKTVQRSSSMKEDKGHTKKDRTSERRRTCTPVLRTSISGPDMACPAGTQDAEADCTVLHIGQEDITLVQGNVKKYKNAIESRSSMSEGDPVTSPESVSDIVSPSSEVTKPRSASLPLEADAEPQQGSVLKQKRELECRLGSECSGGSSDIVTGVDTTTRTTVAEGKPPSGRVMKDIPLTASCRKPEGATRGEDKCESDVHSTEAASTELSASRTLPTVCPEGDTVGTSPDVEGSGSGAADSSSSSQVSAYPSEDIPWSVGTVRQQKEAIEKVNSASAATGESRRGSSKSPTQADDGISSDAAGLLRTSSCKTIRPLVTDDSTSGVARSASLKENALHARSELKVSLSKPTRGRIHVSQKDIVITTSSSSDTQGAQQAVPKVPPPEVRRWTDTKQVLIVEAPKPAASKPDIPPPTPSAECTDKLPQSSTTLKPMEEKTVKDLVDIFDSVKPKEKTSPEDQTEVDALLEPQVMSRSKSMSCRSAGTEKAKLDRKASLPSYQPSKESPGVAAAKVGETLCAAPIDSGSKAEHQQQQVSTDIKLGTSPSGLGSTRIPMTTHREPDPEGVPRKCRKLQGKTHPLSRLSLGEDGSSSPHSTGVGETTSGRATNPVYNTT